MGRGIRRRAAVATALLRSAIAPRRLSVEQSAYQTHAGFRWERPAANPDTATPHRRRAGQGPGEAKPPRVADRAGLWHGPGRQSDQSARLARLTVRGPETEPRHSIASLETPAERDDRRTRD
jgi:hypothetical protein